MEKLELHSLVKDLEYQGGDWLSQKDQTALRSTKTTSKNTFLLNSRNTGDVSMENKCDTSATDRLIKELALRNNVYTLVKNRCQYSVPSAMPRNL